MNILAVGVEVLDKDGHNYGEQLPGLRGDLKLHGGVVREDGLHHRQQAIELHKQIRSVPSDQIPLRHPNPNTGGGSDWGQKERARKGGQNLLLERGGVAFTTTSATGCDGEEEEASGSSAASPLAEFGAEL
jgi:hypothetical protein